MKSSNHLAAIESNDRPKKRYAPKVKVGERLNVVPDGIYKVTLVEIKEGSYSGKRKIYEFFFSIAEGPYSGTVVRAFVNAHYKTFSAHTKAYEWYRVATKDELAPGDELDFEVFYDKVFEAEIEAKKSRLTKNAFSNVTALKSVVFDPL